MGKFIVPIVPDEARTFGMEALFRQVGIYSSVGQNYEPVDMDTLLYYKEAKNGQILEEGITEVGVDVLVHRSRHVRMRTTESTRFRSSSTTPCSDFSGLAT